MKKFPMAVTLAVLAFSLFVFAGPVRAQMGAGMMGGIGDEAAQQSDSTDHTQSLDTVLQNLMQKYSVSKVQDLDCSKVSDSDFESLGDAWMETMHPGQAHEVMDTMMGGEGSDSLRAAHIQMGENYLGCNASGRAGMMGSFGGMMGGGMMGNWNTAGSAWRGGAFPMMGWGPAAGYGGIAGAITWVALIIFLASGSYFFIRQAGRKK